MAWCHDQGQRYLTADKLVVQEHQRAERLATRLREWGIDPDTLA